LDEYLNSGRTARATSEEALVAHSFNPVANRRISILRTSCTCSLQKNSGRMIREDRALLDSNRNREPRATCGEAYFGISKRESLIRDDRTYFFLATDDHSASVRFVGLKGVLFLRNTDKNLRETRELQD